MPNRIIRDGILSSESVCSLGWAAEVFYRRLQSVVDDYGRFEAHPKLLRSKCYPIQFDKVSDADIGKWLADCATAGLVSVYPAADGKRYLQVEKFGQRIQAAKSKYPSPTLSTDVHGFPRLENRLDVGEVVVVNDKEQNASPAAPPPAEPKEKRASRLPDDWTLPDEWAAWARKERPDLNPVTVAADFADYWRGVPGKDGRKLDWLATWRKWVRNERAKPANAAPPSGVPRGKPAGPSETPEQARANWERQMREYGA